MSDPVVTAHLGIDDMVRQHRAVRIEVSELRAMIDSRQATQRTDGDGLMLAVLVARLRDRLALHFEIEEESTVIARLLAAQPETAADIARFAVEHRALLAAGSRLAEQLRTPNPPPEVFARTMQWLEELRQHEQGEDLFLARIAAP